MLTGNFIWKKTVLKQHHSWANSWLCLVSLWCCLYHYIKPAAFKKNIINRILNCDYDQINCNYTYIPSNHAATDLHLFNFGQQFQLKKKRKKKFNVLLKNVPNIYWLVWLFKINFKYCVYQLTLKCILQYDTVTKPFWTQTERLSWRLCETWHVSRYLHQPHHLRPELLKKLLNGLTMLKDWGEVFKYTMNAQVY